MKEKPALKPEIQQEAPRPVALSLPVTRVSLALAKLLPPLHNPRTIFTDEMQADLEASIAEHGFSEALSLLLVRPIEYRKKEPQITNCWHIECRFPGGEWKPVRNVLPESALWKPAGQGPDVLLSEEDADAAIAELPTHEIVDGERRYRACRKLNVETVPCNVGEFTDEQALAFQLVSAIQRAQLSVLDEAAGVCTLIELKNADGAPVYTAASLALKLGKVTAGGKPDLMFITRCRQLAVLRGTAAGNAIESGELSASHGELIGRLPTQALRDEVTKLALKGRGDGPLPVKGPRGLEETIRERYTTQLKGSHFDQADAELVQLMTGEGGARIGGGACTDCPFNSANLPVGNGEKPGKFQMCMNTDCYRRKQRAAYEKWAAGQDVEVVPYDEREEYLDYTGKRLPFNSGFVEIEERPAEHLLKENVKNPPPWKKLIAGKDVPQKILRDDEGAVHRIAPKALAIAAAKANGHRIFDGDEEADAKEQLETEKRRTAFIEELRKDPDNAAMSTEEAAAEFERQERERQREKTIEAQKKAQRERELEHRLLRATGKALLQSVKSQKKIGAEFWALLMPPLVDMACDSDDFQYLAELFAVQYEGDVYTEGAEAFKAMVAAAPQEHVPAIALMLVSTMVRYGELEAWQKKAFKTFGVDVKAVQKAEREAMAAEEKAAAEQAEIENGLHWVTRREKASDFEWEGRHAINPDVCEVKMPADVKAEVSLFAARGKKGWAAGFKVTSKKLGHAESAVEATGPDYGTRELAIVTMLQAISAHFAKAKATTAVARIEAYIARLTTPSAPAEKAGKVAKKKGASK